MEQAPDSFSWLEHSPNVLPPVRDQEDCGICHAFTAAAAVSANLAIYKGGDMFECSKQELLDCLPEEYKDHIQENDPYTGNFSCTAEVSLDYIQKYGVCRQSLYNWEGMSNACRHRSEKDRVSIEKYGSVYRANDGKDQELKHAIIRGPICGTINHFGSCLRKHKGNGAYMVPQNSPWSEAKHAMLVIGYGEEDGALYYEVQNSWGVSWCNNGYGKIRADLFDDQFVYVEGAYLMNQP